LLEELEEIPKQLEAVVEPVAIAHLFQEELKLQ
jgi:hypothetical protein